MFDIYFYNSYNLSASGFQMIKLDYEAKESTLIYKKNSTDFPAEVNNYLTHGGVKMLFSKIEDGKYIYVVKGITCEDPSKGNDEAGRKWFINLAFVSDISALESLYSVVMLALTDFETFKQKIVELLTVSNGEISYSIDYEKLQEFMENNKKSFDNTYSVLNAPYDLSGEKFTDLLKDIMKVNTKEELLFVILDSDMDYFYSSYGYTKKVTPKYSFVQLEPVSKDTGKSADKSNYSYTYDDHTISKSTRNAILIGVGIICAGACIGYLVGLYDSSKNK